MTEVRPGALRIGVVGAGAMGTSHVRTLGGWVPGCRVSAVYDFDAARSLSVAEEAGAVSAASASDLIKSADVDAVIVAAPDPLHEELVLECLAAGKPVLCEKPLAMGAEGSHRLVDAEVAGGRRLIQVGFMRRFDPAYVALRHAVADGGIGTPRVVHCVHRNAQAHPSATSDGVIVNSMIHELDVVPWLLDDPLAAITVFAGQRPDGELRDPQVAVLETRGGTLVTAEVFVNARYGYDVRCEVVGDAGTARLTPPYGLSLRQSGTDGVVVSDDFVGRFSDAYRIELAGWVSSVRSGVAHGPSAWDGHLANLAATAGVESLHSGNRVEIPALSVPELYR
ncbi:putative Inositol 2-dehydrogenase 1 [metagenome]|uniref:Putative Inositol 2-dehydrogenase 1 n=1 Tax=metagenome TaxID=256318 RepID=A0A2P2CIK9_9ZZZZ